MNTIKLFSISLLILLILNGNIYSQVNDNNNIERYSFSRDIRLAPGEYYAVKYDKKRHEFVEEEPDRGYGGLSNEAQLQILKAPKWLRENLADRLVELCYDDIDVGENAAPVFYDVNKDGIDDLIVGNAEGTLKCFLAPYFKEDTSLLKHISVSSDAVPCFYDIDGDGQVDLIVGDAAGGMFVWKGEKWKQPVTLDKLPFSGQVHPVFVQRNGLLVGDTTGQVWLHIIGSKFKLLKENKSGNNGSFSAPVLVKGSRLQLLGSEEGKIHVICNKDGNEKLIENLERAGVAGNSRPVFQDINHDGVPDLVVGSSDGTISIFINYGITDAPWFTTYSSDYQKKFNIDAGYLSSPRIADINSDGVPDIVSGTKDGIVRFFQGPDFKEQDNYFKTLHFNSVVVPAPGDFNGDGKLDIAIGSNDGSVQIFMAPEFINNDILSEGIKVESYATPYPTDFDKDGNIDLLIGSGNDKIHFFRNTGNKFTEVPNFFDTLNAGKYPSPAAIDVNNDGSLDLVTGNQAGEIKVFLAPDWKEEPKGLGINNISTFTSLAFGDLTGDSEPELVIGGLDGTLKYFENDNGYWIEKQSWDFESSSGFDKVDAYFQRCHPASDLLQGMIDKETPGAFIKVMAEADDKYFDEIAFVISATTSEVLRAMFRLDNTDLLLENAQDIYNIADKVKYAAIVEKKDYTTLKYIVDDGDSTELPRDIYYWWVVHPHLYYEIPSRVDASYWEHDNEYYGITHEKWTRKKLELENYEKGDKRQFWRSYFVKDNKYGKTLLEITKPAENVKEAIYLIGDWVSQTLPEAWFSYGRKSDDTQPNIIYQKNYGSCGEASILGAAFLRTMLIPASCAGCSGEDHIWNEFWLNGEWHIMDPGRTPFNINYAWGSCEGIEHKGTQVLTVTRHRGDNCIETTTTTVANPPGCNSTKTGKGYTDVAHVTIQVVDTEAKPIEGAMIAIRSNCYDYYKFSVYGYTDADGLCYFELGKPNNKCVIDIITQQGITGTSHFPVIENEDYNIKYVVSGKFNGRIYTQKQFGSLKNSDNILTVNTKILEEEQRPRSLFMGRRYGSETEFSKKTGYKGTRWTSYYNHFIHGIALCRLSKEEFNNFKKTQVLPEAVKIIDITISFGFNPEDEYVYLYYNTNRFTHVRFSNNFTAELSNANPEIQFTEIPKQVKTGEKISFTGSATDNLHINSLEVSIDGGINWTDITHNLCRETDTFSYILNTGDGGPLAPGNYPVIYKVTDNAGNYKQTTPAIVAVEKSSEFHNQIIYQDNTGSPLPVSSWVLGPFEVHKQERFLGITTSSEDKSFDMDMFLFHDKNGNRKLDGMEEQKMKSSTPSANEEIILNNPPEGLYWIYCQGWKVNPRKDTILKENNFNEYSPGKFLNLDYSRYQNKIAFAYQDISLSFDYKPTFIIDISPVGKTPADEMIIKGNFENGKIDTSTVKIIIDGNDMTKDATVHKKGFELKLIDVLLDSNYTVCVEAKTCYGDIDKAEWEFVPVFMPVKIEHKLIADKKALEVILQCRNDYQLKEARARFWNKQKGEEKSKWFKLELAQDNKSCKKEISVDGQKKGNCVLEVEYQITGNKTESKEIPFKVTEDYSNTKDIVIYPEDEAKVYDFSPVLSAYVLGEYKVKVKSFKFILDEINITDKCKIYEDKIKYFPKEDLKKGQHTLECIVTLKDGSNINNKSSFTINTMFEEETKEKK